jgi:hypothetical protein
VRTIGVDANRGAAPLTTSTAAEGATDGSKPTPPTSVSSAAVDDAHVLRITQCFAPSRVWCIGQTWPGATPGQHASSADAVTSARLTHIATGAAIRPANWHNSQTDARARSIGRIDVTLFILPGSNLFYAGRNRHRRSTAMIGPQTANHLAGIV